ncbi:hypothetical protein PPTG_04613 [Phytophthora nicotianae INRA-310]|uniref:Uncharacterized protein n=1 Tax=Phytophthora nicotianae (strain INRA-310) TaxID=761204 RepID=W2R1D0_PHYN3|nr:hypothetical protein PPTG_04613 [Phytophthora nicotianae INRA-310]ETN19247.1 hypothetical protein PPTG_04613 [Phytophthora nicotianae INRA-310]
MSDHRLLLKFDIDVSTMAVPRVDSPKLHPLEYQQLLEDTDSLLQSLYSVTSPSTNAAQNKKTATEIAKTKADKRRDSYRQRIKVERETLRFQKAELSRKLALLKKQRIEQKAPTILGNSLNAIAWKTIAMRQYEARREAEALRKALRAEVTRRALVIRDIQGVMRKRSRGAHKEVDDLLEAVETKPRSSTRDGTLFNAYFASLETLYGKLDEVFEEAGINSRPASGKMLGGEPARKMHGETPYLENIGVTKVPFNYQRTCEAVWELLSAQHRQDERSDYYGLPCAENAKAFQYCSSLRRENGAVLRLKTHQVSRQYIENSRMVVVWRALSEAAEEFPGLNMDETGWCVIHAPTSDSDCSKDSTSTLVQACIRLTPMYHCKPCGSEQRRKLDQFMELSAKSVAEDNMEIEYMMERLLLDEALSTDGLAVDEEGNLALGGF